MTSRTDKETNQNPLPNGTKVLNTQDGEPGTILNGFAYCADTGEWCEYEVVTAYGIEVWSRDQFVLMSELEAAVDEAEAKEE